MASLSIRQGVLNLPSTPQAKALVEQLLEEDRQKHHCFWGRVGFHNHLSHHLLAAYDLGAPPKLLQAIFDAEKEGLDPIHLADRKEKKVEEQHVNIDKTNWQQYLGQEKYYAPLLKFFTEEIARLGAGQLLEEYVFAPAANGNGANMLRRFISGAVHPTIQTGYGVEFGSDSMVAQALAQTAVHSYDFVPDIHVLDFQSDIPASNPTSPEGHRQPFRGLSLLEILRQVYDSPILEPVMPYDFDALLSKRRADASKGGRPEEIARLAGLWIVDTSKGQAGLDEKVEELLWVTTLLLAGSGRKGRKPRLDFFLMHLLNVSIFIPSLLDAIPSAESKVTLVRSLLTVILSYILLRGRPRIDAELMMSYTATPHPPITPPKPDTSALGDPTVEDFVDPWPAIVSSVQFAPDAHTIKAIRALYFAARKYGTTPAGRVIGAFRDGGEETHIGIGKVDGTVFVRAAGVVMNTLGWVNYGQKEGQWDRSAHGWDDAWKTPDV
ncbi:hypothetical protein BXZ70DRAFT_887737 [Cristinia sonorae]|uniref:Uncharacterized protein n=1 Tax=Cristinia sonorae TaxID=1940300 RepID=A0A8K0XSP0_9AGAR|nr:hypothetical protein BXZ70DRAFT_887737 [Cristinia sonorae]